MVIWGEGGNCCVARLVDNIGIAAGGGRTIDGCGSITSGSAWSSGPGDKALEELIESGMDAVISGS